MFAGPKDGAAKWKMIKSDEHSVVKFKDEGGLFALYLQVDPKDG